MAQLEKLEASTEINSSADTFYGFFRNDMSELVNVIPDTFLRVELFQGEEGSVGAVKLWKYVLIGGISLSVTLETVAIDDEKRSITFKAIDGDVLVLYKTYQFTVAVSDDVAHWTIEYEKAFVTASPPDAYIALAIMTSKLVGPLPSHPLKRRRINNEDTREQLLCNK